MSVDISSPVSVLNKRGASEFEYTSSCKRTIVSPQESFDLGRKKRSRGLGYGDADDSKDKLAYSQRHIEFFEQCKQAEFSKLKFECDQLLMRKDQEIASFKKQNEEIRSQFSIAKGEVDRLSGENKILRRAVSIQNQQKEASVEEAKVLKNLLEQAAEHIKRLEQSNYALRVHLQSTGQGMGYNSTTRGPPDVF